MKLEDCIGAYWVNPIWAEYEAMYFERLNEDEDNNNEDEEEPEKEEVG
jgi:hypothetical protein